MGSSSNVSTDIKSSVQPPTIPETPKNTTVSAPSMTVPSNQTMPIPSGPFSMGASALGEL